LLDTKEGASLEKEIFLSLIVATTDRTNELECFLRSIMDLRNAFLEVLVVDQNSDDRLNCIIVKYCDRINIKRLKLAEKNASKARNYGASQAAGKWLGFPDDDCIYRSDTIEKLKQVIEKEKPSIIQGLVVDFDEVPLNKTEESIHKLTTYNFSKRVFETAFFIQKKSFDEIGGFDDNFGPGGSYPGAEACELIARFIKSIQGKVYYESEIKVIHPRKIPPYNEMAMDIGYRCSYGFGAMLSKHFGLWVLLYIIQYTVKFIFKLIVFKGNHRKFAIASFQGLFGGFYKKFNEGLIRAIKNAKGVIDYD
jgi:glycosyltransferase involved in cell wall biosynthesis